MVFFIQPPGTHWSQVAANDSEFAARLGRFLFVKLIIEADFNLLAGNIPHPRYAVGLSATIKVRVVRIPEGAPRIKHFFCFIATPGHTGVRLLQLTLNLPLGRNEIYLSSYLLFKLRSPRRQYTASAVCSGSKCHNQSSRVSNP